MSPKHGFLAQKLHFWPPKGSLWAIGAIKQPAEQTYQTFNSTQSYLWICGRHDSIESGQFEPKKQG